KVLRSSPCDTSAALQAMAENNARAIPAARLILTCPDLSPQSALPPLSLLSRNGRENEAEKYLAGRLTRAGSTVQREKWLNTAENIGFTDLAYTGYAQLFQKFPDRPTYGQTAARLASWTERYRERADILAVLAKRDPGNAPVVIRAARAFEEAGQPERALPLYLRALTMAPETENLRIHTLKLLGDLGRHKKRFELLDAQRKNHPLTRPEIRFLLEDALALNRAAQVVKEAEQMEQDPKRSLRDLMQAVQILSRAGAATRAETALDRARRLSNNSPEELRALGTAALYDNFLAVALACFQDVLSRIPEDGTALKGSAMIHAANNDAMRAISFFRRYLARHPEDAGARYQLGELLFVNGRQDEAQMEFTEAIRTLKPDRSRP
ncbi:MAG TPA: tetratricopeptide repeat protein, partial [Desulfomicrobiaceae bacterium]|nr:tetratricopeptide repeat protein [Desulfomicrobiaceae bacterium]